MDESTSPTNDRLKRALEEAQRRGFLGPGPVAAHVEHAGRFVAATGTRAPTEVLDLGTGGGVPGLVLAFHWQSSNFVLLDASNRRTEFLVDAVRALDLDERVTVVQGRAEEIAHRAGYRRRFDLVVARSFGPPAVVAECAAGFICLGGILVVSEPPDTTGERWPEEGLSQLGMNLVSVGGGTVVISQERSCPERFPRRVGVPAKRPLF